VQSLIASPKVRHPGFPGHGPQKMGSPIIPRIGMESSSEFLKATRSAARDRVCVNGDNKTPFVLPSKKNISGVGPISTKDTTATTRRSRHERQRDVFLPPRRDFRCSAGSRENGHPQQPRGRVLQEGNDDLRSSSDRQVQSERTFHECEGRSERVFPVRVHLSLLMGKRRSRWTPKVISMKPGGSNYAPSSHHR